MAFPYTCWTCAVTAIPAVRAADTPTKQQVWTDMHLFMQFVKSKNPDLPLFLGGHSSGCGAVLNYLSYYTNNLSDGFVFISPEFGYKSGTANPEPKKSVCES